MKAAPLRLIALDMSASVGWVHYARPGDLADRGTEPILPSADLARRFNQFFIWLLAKLEVHRPDVLAWEEPIRDIPGRPFGGKTTMATRKFLQGLAAVADLAGYRCGIGRRIEVPTATAKKKLAGHGHADKDMMIAAAVAMGITVADEHQADALAVALCAYEHCGVFVRGHDPLLQSLSRW